MSWRYMSARETFQGEEVWTIREVYDGASWTDPIEPSGDSHRDLIKELRMMLLEAEHRDFLDLDAGHVSQRLDGSDGDEEAAMTPEVKAELELLNQVRALVHGTPYWRKINDAKLRRLFINDQPNRREG